MKKAKQNIISTVSNEPKDFEREEPIEIPVSKGTKKKAEPVSGKLTLLKDERFVKITGLVFLLTSVFMAFAFGSFLFSWQYDQNIAKGLGWMCFCKMILMLQKIF
jgi:hypothetical protein